MLETMRRHAAGAGTPSVAVFADRLEGRAALAKGDAAAAVDSLERAVRGFGDLAAVWERAVTQVDLAGAFRAVGRDREAEAAAASAAATFEELGSIRELARARGLAGPT